MADGAAALARLADRPAVGAGLYTVGRLGASLLLHALAKPRLEGRDRVPRTGGLLVVANHCSVVDPPLLAALLPRRLAFLAKEELFHPAPWGVALRAAGMIPVRRGRPERGVLDAALAVLGRGGAVVVFAEGTRSRDGVLGRAEPGAGLLALRAGVPVLPVAILGTERLRRPGVWARRPALVVRCGPVWRPPSGDGLPRAYRRVADEVMTLVAALLPPSRRGPYGAERDAPAESAGTAPLDHEV